MSLHLLGATRGRDFSRVYTTSADYERRPAKGWSQARVGDVLDTLFKGGVAATQSYLQQREAGDTQAREKLADASALDKAETVDRNAARAIADALTNQALGKPIHADTVKADALADVDKVADALSVENAQARVLAAEHMADLAEKDAKAHPRDGYKAALSSAWSSVSARIHSGPSADSKKDSSGESWFTRRVLGPVPGYGVVGLGAGVLVGVGWIAKKLFFRS